MTDGILPDLPVISPGTARFIAKKAAEQAAKDAEEQRIKAMGDAVWGAIHRTAWRLAVAFALLPGPALAHDWYHTLKIPGTQTARMPEGVSCCDDRDCAPTRARHGPLGWEAETPAGGWVSVPIGRVIVDKAHPAGSAVLCWRPDAGAVCFVPPTAGG